MSKYDWDKIQADYNSGLSYRGLQDKYGMSSRTLTMAARKGRLVTRSKSEAAILDNRKNPRTHSNEFKEKQRERINKRYAEGWQPKAGRCKKIRYVSPIAGEVSLDGTWELSVAQWLDWKAYQWERNTKRFKYTNLEGNESHYTPDFYISGMGYLEVKGYKTELDDCKWSQFKEPLTVWYKEHILDIQSQLTEGCPRG